jgi:hypothetical protein
VQLNEYESFPYDGLVEDPEPECNCEEYLGAVKPGYCPVHEIWSDDLEIALQEQAEKEAA